MNFTKLQIAIFLTLMMLVPACARTGEKPSDTKYDMSGQWHFEVPVGNNVTKGSMTLVSTGVSTGVSSGPVYTGTLTTNQGDNILEIQSFSLKGAAIEMIVLSPQGNVVFIGTLNHAENSFSGEVTYHTGARYPMSGGRS